MITPPKFWQTGGLPAQFLAPFGEITRRVTARRVAGTGWRAPVPVICCGNAGVGGAGKTPLALDLARRLLARGVRVHFLTRGFGGTAKTPMRVDAATDDAAVVGDEPLLLAARAPTWIGADRAATARLATAAGAQALIMDDGLQNPSLEKSCALLVVDGAVGFGNGRLLPAGPLREPIAAAASRCRAAVIIGDDTACAAAALPPGLQILHARLSPGESLTPLLGQRIHAFAGIGRPDKFFAMLREHGAPASSHSAFPDHHRYTDGELATLRSGAAREGAVLVTTEKDFVRLRPAQREGIFKVGAALVWQNDAAIDGLLADALIL